MMIFKMMTNELSTFNRSYKKSKCLVTDQLSYGILVFQCNKGV